MRTQASTLVIENFTGVNQVLDEIKLDGRSTPWMAGMQANERGQLERILGKKLISPQTTGGSVFSVADLHFADRRLILVHQTTNWFTEDSFDSLIETESLEPVTPLEPFEFEL